MNEEIFEILKKNYLKEFRLDLHQDNIRSRSIHDNPRTDVEKTIEITMSLPAVQLYWKIVDNEEKKNAWIQARRDEVKEWDEKEKLRKEQSEANRLIVAKRLSSIDYKLLSFQTLSILLNTAVKELLPEDRPK